VSNPSKAFECRWQPSRRLLAVYLGAQLGAWLALLVAAFPLWMTLLGGALCSAHAVWAWRFATSHFSGIRHDADGWHLWQTGHGWQSVQLFPDSVALPQVVVLRFRLPGQWWVRGLCVASDALPVDVHRRLRVRLKFTRRRWAAPE